MSKSSKRIFVPNTTRGIVDSFARKRSRVQGDRTAIETDMQSTVTTPKILARKGVRVQAARPPSTETDLQPTRKSVHVQAAAPPSTETDLQPTLVIPNNANSTGMNEDVDFDSTTITQRPTAGESMNDASIEFQSILPHLPKKKTRGKNRGLNADRVHEMLGKKIPITVDVAIGRPTCQYAEMFAREIGFVVRNYAPMTVEQWKNVSSEDLSKLVKRLSTKYDFDMSQTGVDRYVHKTFSSCFTNFRTMLKNYFKTFSTMEEALKNRHKQVKSNEEWIFLCNYFSSAKFKALSEKNAINRSKLLYHHKAGSRSFMALAARSTETLGAIELFESEYKSGAKGWDSGAKQKHDEMVLLRDETTQEDGTRTMTDEEICRQVVGVKSGYIKGCGFGPRPTPIKPSQPSFHEMYEKNKGLEDKIKDQNEQITELRKKMEQFMASFSTPQLEK